MITINNSEPSIHQDQLPTQDIPACEKRGSAFRHLLLSFLLCLGISYFVLRGGWSLGFFLAVLTTELVFFAWLLLPFPGGERDVQNPPQMAGRKVPLAEQIVLAALIIDLAFCYLLYDNILLKVLNFPIICALCMLQYLMAARVFPLDWDKPRFWGEAILSAIVRPFIGLPGFGGAVSRIFSRSQPSSRHALGKVLLGILLSFPGLLLSGTALAAADPLFAKILEQLMLPWRELSMQELFINLLIAIMLLPFIFSFLYSGRSGKQVAGLPPGAVQPADAPARTIPLDKTILITFLTCINLLYLVFAYIQLAYLTGAFTAALPDGMTYAEYARSGFFELSAISAVNLILILLAVKAADRRGAAGLVLRIESLLLLAGSLVQWASAMFRMKMYVGVYGLTLLRFLVTAFMLLLAVMFIALVIKEFRPRFPLFKAFTAAILASLLILNHANCDAWIARYNVQHYQTTGLIDLAYYNELSVSAVPAVLSLTNAADPSIQKAAARNLLFRYATGLEQDAAARWQTRNISRIAAKRLIEAHLEELKAINPDAGAQMPDWR
jgi:hypothetical protein